MENNKVEINKIELNENEKIQIDIKKFNINEEYEKRNLTNSYCWLFGEGTYYSLEKIENNIAEIDKQIRRYEEEINKWIYKIGILREEKENKIKEAEKIKSKNTKIAIYINEKPKKGEYSNYKLYLSVKKITEDGKDIISVLRESNLGFSQRVTIRNEYLLEWVNEYDIAEINTNVDIFKFIKENKLDNIKINYKQNK